LLPFVVPSLRDSLLLPILSRHYRAGLSYAAPAGLESRDENVRVRETGWHPFFRAVLWRPCGAGVS